MKLIEDCELQVEVLADLEGWAMEQTLHFCPSPEGKFHDGGLESGNSDGARDRVCCRITEEQLTTGGWLEEDVVHCHRPSLPWSSLI